MTTGVYYPATNIISWNMCGRFRGKEIKDYGDTVLELILVEKQVDVMLGQQLSYLPGLPEQYSFIGAPKAFVIYNTNAFRCCDERQFRLKIRDLQVLGKLPYHYLKDQNFTVCKLQSKVQPGLEFLALSWFTDECMGDVRSVNILKKLSHLAYNLSLIEEMPIIIGGTFRLPGTTAQKNLDSEFKCFDYEPMNARRAIRSSDCFITSREVVLDEVAPLVLGRMVLNPDQAFRKHFWVSPEDIFYFDPVMCYLPGIEVNVEGDTNEAKSTPVAMATMSSSLTTMSTIDDVLDSGSSVDPKDLQERNNEINLNNNKEIVPASGFYRFSSLQSLYSGGENGYNGYWCNIS